VGVCLSFVSPEVGKWKGGLAWNSMGMCGGGLGWDRRLLWLIYTPVFAVSCGSRCEEENPSVPELCDRSGERTLSVSRPVSFPSHSFVWLLSPSIHV